VGGPAPELEALFQQLNSQFFDSALTPVPVVWNARLTSRLGRYLPVEGRIEISPHLHREHGWGHVRDTVLHEMVHHRLNGSATRPHGPEFKAEAKRVGLASIHGPALQQGYRWLYVCPACHRQYPRRRRGVWSCGRCSRTYDPRFKLRLVRRLG